MNVLPLFNPPSLYIEIGPNSLHVMRENEGLELPVERQDNGLLTPACKAKLVESLRNFVRPPAWPPRPKAYCAIGARGVSMRRLTLPAASGEELRRLLLLQIESEFPLTPDELAWGCHPVDGNTPSGNGAGNSRDWIVVAVKKETIEDYALLLSECGLEPVFTLGALARRGYCQLPPEAYAIVDVAAQCSELISFAQGTPVSMRVLPWGAEDALVSIQKKLGVGRAEAIRLLSATSSNTAGTAPPTVQACELPEWEKFAQCIQNAWTGKKIYVAGAHAAAIATGLQTAFGGRVECVPMGPLTSQGHSAATLGLRHFCEQNGGAPPLVFEAKAPKAKDPATRAASWTWAALALALACGAYGLRYAEPVLFQGHLAKVIAETQAKKARLPNIDRELNFLQYLKTNQPPYLEAVAAIANSAPGGMKIESLALTRRGDLTFRGFVRDMQQALDFRAKLGDSGFFNNVVLEEQSPTPDRQKMNLRIVAQWKPVVAREALIKELALPENNKTNAAGIKTNFAGSPDSAPPVNMGVPPGGMMMPPGMPPAPSGPIMNMEGPAAMPNPPMDGGSTPPMMVPPNGGPPSVRSSRRALAVPNVQNVSVEKKD